MMIALALTATLLLAQSTTPPTAEQRVERRVKFLTEQLSLSWAQQEQATTIFLAVAKVDHANRTGMKTAQETMRTAIKNNDSAAIDVAAKGISSLMAQGISTEAKAQAAFYQLLTPEQQANRAALGSPGFGGHGPGRPGRPGVPIGAAAAVE
jgi:Spy/CpxP family protein refolding chaperone